MEKVNGKNAENTTIEHNNNSFEEFCNFNSIDTKIEIYINEIVKNYLKENKIKIIEEAYGIDWGTKIVTTKQTIEQEHENGSKRHQIFIGSSKIFDGDMIRYDILNPKEKDIDKVRIKIDEILNVETPVGKLILSKLDEKFVEKVEENEDDSGAQKILKFMRKEHLNKDDLLMALSLMFDEITNDKNCAEDDSANEEKNSQAKNEIKNIIEKSSSENENPNGTEQTVGLVKYKKSLLNKIVDWFYE